MDIGNTFSLKDEYIRDKYKTAKIDFIRGHIKTIGRTSNQEKNPLWKIQNENGTTIIVMYCEVDTFCILCPTSYQKILDYEKMNNKGNKITWGAKYQGEIIRDTVQANATFKAISLRYFNPIGAHKSALIGELPLGPPANLIPFLTQSVAGLRGPLQVWGTDYPTADGTAMLHRPG